MVAWCNLYAEEINAYIVFVAVSVDVDICSLWKSVIVFLMNLQVNDN